MKKTYIRPTAKVAAMHQSQMICSSPEFSINEDEGGVQDAEANTHRSWFELWSED